MRKEKLVDINGKKVAVKELRVKDVRQFMEDAEKMGDVPLKEILRGENYNRLCQLFVCCTDLKPEEIDELSISELEAIGKAIMELNEHFFGLLKILGAAATMTG